MTPKDIKKRHPGCQVKKTQSKSNGYNLLIGYFGTHTLGKVEIYDDIHLYLNNKYIGHWDCMVKPPKPIMAVWNNGTTKFTYINLNLKIKEKNFKSNGDNQKGVNTGEWIEIDRQFDYNEYTAFFLENYMTEFARNFHKKSYKWRGMYEICEKVGYPITHASCAQYCAFTPELSWAGTEIGIYHYQFGELLPPIPISIYRSKNGLEIFVRKPGQRGQLSDRIILNDKEVKAGNLDLSILNRTIIERIFS